jgi:hypothetical protein
MTSSYLAIDPSTARRSGKDRTFVRLGYHLPGKQDKQSIINQPTNQPKYHHLLHLLNGFCHYLINNNMCFAVVIIGYFLFLYWLRISM